MSDSYIVSGTLFGDEGKGSICDYLTSKYDIHECVRYNGGSQASHTVISDNILHKFSQLGSSSLNSNVRTYLSSNTVVNLFNIYSEAKVFSSKTNRNINSILSNIYIDKNARIVTPYHALINQMREIYDKNNRIGSVGTGVSEVQKVYENTNIVLRLEDFYNGNYKTILKELFEYTRKYYLDRKDYLDKTNLLNSDDLYYLTNECNSDYIIKCYENLFNSGIINCISDFNSFHIPNNDILFEGSQGFLIDSNYGIRPNTTSLDTTNHYGVKLASLANCNIHTVGATSAFMSRHGLGLLPTQTDDLNIYDSNQLASFYQGSPRYGWFDSVLFNYSLKYNEQNEIFLSQLDRLSGYDKLKICTSYLYYGSIDEEFTKTFDYYVKNNKVYIYGIKRNSLYLRRYLSKIIPIYIEVSGWNEDISNVSSYDDLPINAKNYIRMIEELSNSNIAIIGISPERNKKLEKK